MVIGSFRADNLPKSDALPVGKVNIIIFEKS